MYVSQPVFARLRGLRIAMLVAFGLGSVAFGRPQGAPSAPVVGIEPTRVADLVVLGGGFDVGLRQGMVCRVTRGATEIAEVLLVEIRPSCSAALILSVAPKQSIRPGDVVASKVLKS